VPGSSREAGEPVRGVDRAGLDPRPIGAERQAVAAAWYPCAVSTYRVEHRTAGTATVVAHTSDVHASQEELSQHAARLTAAGATGELVLVDETTGEDVARRYLRAEDGGSGGGERSA
jgi:hypothetical protein